MDALNANGKTQLFTNLVWRSKAHTAVRKTSSERIFFYKNNNKNTTTNNNNNKKQTNKNGELEPSRTKKKFDKLLMFIVGKDSALFSGL